MVKGSKCLWQRTRVLDEGGPTEASGGIWGHHLPGPPGGHDAFRAP
jgi:hypothetical protein